jgi:transcriptional repressor NrdR
MKCPFCGYLEDKVIDSRASTEGTSIRRRRECLHCEKRFTTFEQIEEVPIMVIKKNGARESFSIKKIKEGVIKACEKRPVSLDQIDDLVSFVNESVEKLQVREVESQVIGELVMKRLQDLDEVAYVRFASVYRQFKDVSQFMQELSSLLKK